MIGISLLFGLEVARGGQEAEPFLQDLLTYYIPRGAVTETLTVRRRKRLNTSG